MRLRESRQHNGNDQQNQGQYRSPRYLHVPSPSSLETLGLALAIARADGSHLLTGLYHEFDKSALLAILAPVASVRRRCANSQGEVSKYDNQTSIHCRTMHSCLPLPGNARRLTPLPHKNRIASPISPELAAGFRLMAFSLSQARHAASVRSTLAQSPRSKLRAPYQSVAAAI